MGRTIPSFRITPDMKKEEWKPFRAALDKSERKEFEDMWDILDPTCPRALMCSSIACHDLQYLYQFCCIAMSIKLLHFTSKVMMVRKYYYRKSEKEY
jgi:hypothetical protein